jgi:hypothetical protein
MKSQWGMFNRCSIGVQTVSNPITSYFPISPDRIFDQQRSRLSKARSQVTDSAQKKTEKEIQRRRVAACHTFLLFIR